MDHNNESERSGCLEPRTLEEALSNIDLPIGGEKLVEDSVDFDLDDSHVFKLDGASLTITSK